MAACDVQILIANLPENPSTLKPWLAKARKIKTNNKDFAQQLFALFGLNNQSLPLAAVGALGEELSQGFWFVLIRCNCMPILAMFIY